jgi:pimeloyl-ACP methyl ester carboxylesterase
MKKRLTHMGTNLYYTDAGIGATILLLHGFGEAGDIWDVQAGFLADQFRVIVPDLPGSGDSLLPETEKGYLSLEEHAAAILHILDVEEIGTCTLVGHSMGGYIALAFAELHPERLQALGLFHSTAMADSEEKKVHRNRSIAFMEQYGASPFLREVIPNLYGESYRRAQQDAVSRHVDQSVSAFSVQVLSAYYKAISQRPDRRQILRNFTGPVFMAIGEDDKTIPLQESLSQCSLPRENHMHIWKNVAHMGMRESPVATNLALQSFMADVNRN